MDLFRLGLLLRLSWEFVFWLAARTRVYGTWFIESMDKVLGLQVGLLPNTKAFMAVQRRSDSFQLHAGIVETFLHSVVSQWGTGVILYFESPDVFLSCFQFSFLS